MIGNLISSISILISVAVISYYFITDGKAGIFGSGWILAILGAPTTLLTWITYKIGFAKNRTFDLLWIVFFYSLQYQLIALFINKMLKQNTYLPRIMLIILILAIVVIISGVFLFRIITAQ